MKAGVSEQDRHRVCQNYEKLERIRIIFRSLEIIDTEPVLRAMGDIKFRLEKYENAIFDHIKKKKLRPASRNTE